MDVFLWVLEAVLVLLGIGIIGFWVSRRNTIPENVQGFLIQLAVSMAHIHAQGLQAFPVNVSAHCLSAFNQIIKRSPGKIDIPVFHIDKGTES